MTKNSAALNLFIDKWLLILPENPTLENFNGEGFPDTTIYSISSGLYLKGNFIINWLIKPANNSWFNHKLHIQGKITTLNTPITPTQSKINQTINILWWSWYNDYINLQNIFTRTCGLNGLGSDNSPCNTGNIISITPLVILNGNYPSKILQ